MKVCIDTSAYIEMHGRHPAVLEFLSECEEIVVPAATVAELAEGFRDDGRSSAKHIELNRFLDKSNVRFIPAGHSIAYRYAEISRSLRRRGTPLPQNDIWIAATAFETSSIILSYDRHFDLIDGLGRLAP